MKHRTRFILFIVIIAICAAVIAAYGGLSVVLSRTALREVNKVLSTIPKGESSVGDIWVNPLTGTISIKDIRYAYYDSTSVQGGKHPGTNIYVEEIEIGSIYENMHIEKKINISSISIIKPQIKLFMDEEHPELCFPNIEIDTTRKPKKLHIKRAELHNFDIRNASLSLQSVRSGLNINANGCTIELHDLAYDSTFTFSDSTYSIGLGQALIKLPDKKTIIRTQNLTHKDQGLLTIGETRFDYSMESKSDTTPSTEIRVERIEIGPLAPKMFFDKNFIVRKANIIRPHMTLQMDEEHPELSFPKFDKDLSKPITLPFDYTELSNLNIKNASFALHSTRTKLDVAANDCSIKLHKLAYNSAFSYSDSIYSLVLAQASVLLPDGSMRIETQNIEHHNKSLLTIGETHLSNTLQVKSDTTPFADISVERIEVGPLAPKMLTDNKILVRNANIIRPHVELRMDEQHPELCFPTTKNKKANKKPITLPFKRAELQNLHIEDISFALHSISSELDVVADNCSLALHHLAFDTAFHYCDSIYSLSLAHAVVMLPDGRMKLETNNIKYKNQGEIMIGETHIANTIPPLQLGDIIKEPYTWINMHVQSVTTSPINPLRKALAKDYTLNNLDVVVADMHVYRDARHKPKKPFPMPQQLLMDIPVVFDITHVNALIQKIHVDFASTNTNIGQIDLSNISAGINNITNKNGETMRVKGVCPMGKGHANVEFNMMMNNDCQFDVRLNAQDLNASFLNSFIRPLVGLTADCVIDTLNTKYTGNSVKSDGTFKLIYKNFSMQAHKEDDIPYQIITKHANTITTLGNSLVAKSNPRPIDKTAREYIITWKRDEWKPFMLYLFGPCIDGVKKTFLPGLYVHLKVKDKKQKNAKSRSDN